MSFKVSGLGWAPTVPDHWEIVPINHVAKMGTGHTPDRNKSEYWQDCDIPWVTTPDATRASGSLRPLIKTDQNISALGMDNSAAVLHPAGTVMLSRTASIGYSVRIGRPMATTQAFVTWTPGERLESRYLLLVLRAMGQEWERLAYGSTHMTIYMPDLESLRIPLPPVEEQRRISDFLESETARLDALAGARQAQIRCLEELWKSRLAHRVDELIGTYGLVPMRRLVNSVEQGWSPQCDDVQADPSEWAVLKTSAVSSGEFMPLEHKKLPADLVPDARYSVAEGDLLMTRGSGSPVHVGVSAVAHPGGRRLLFSDLLYRVRMAEGWLPEFTALVLQSEPIRGFMALLFRGQSGQTIKLRADDIRAIPLPNVPPRVQNEHTAALTEERQALSSAVAALRKSSALLAERRTALITAAVTGQFDVSTASGRGIED